MVVVAAVVLAVAVLPWVGAWRWAALIRSHTGELEAVRLGAGAHWSGPTRFDARELEGLPAPVQRYFRAVLKDGQPIIAAATINISSRGEAWKPFTSRQRVVTRRPGFLWDARVRMFPGDSARVEDSYIAGQGRLAARLWGLFTFAQATGGGEMARGEFMRYFAEAAWYPTALLPSQGVRWAAVDGRTATATIVDGPTTLSLRFSFDDAGLISTVRAESRGAGVGKNMVMLPWECGLSDYQPSLEMQLPLRGEAAWMRAEGRKPYFLGRLTKLEFEFLP